MRRSFSLRLGSLPKFAALAASVLIVLGAGIWMLNHHDGGARNGTSVASKAELIVEGPTVSPTTGPIVAEVSIQQPTDLVQTNQGWYADAIVSRPSSVVIAADTPAAQDTDDAPQ